MNSAYDEMSWRGLISQVTHEDLKDALAKGPITLYCGFDPTADSLHIGNLIPIIGLMHFQAAGHTPIVLIGGATGLIGDPSFKAQERALLTKEQVEINAAGIRKQLEHFISFEGDNAAIMVNNMDWMSQWSYIDFLRDVGKFFSVNTMMARDSVKQRLNDREHGMSYTEFSYSLLQAYDFLHLYDHHNCTLEIGGSDQWGNIVAGMDLTRKMREDVKSYGLTLPLVTKSDGSKFGKSETGNIWLDAERTSPYKFYQFWLNQADADIVTYIKYFTMFSQEAIAELETKTNDAPHERTAQKALAEDMTLRIHGQGALDNAMKASKAMFGGELTGLDEATLQDVFSEMPSSELDRSILSADKTLLDILTENEVFASKGEARRMIKNGGLYLNNQRVDDDGPFTGDSLLTESMAVIRKGKKNYHIIRLQ